MAPVETPGLPVCLGMPMFGSIKGKWHRAQALSALQLYWQLPLKEPLEVLTATDLDMAARVSMAAGGTPYDTAVAFLVLRLESRIRLGTTEDGLTLSQLAGSLWNARDQMKLWDSHMGTIRRLKAMEDGRAEPQT